MAADPSVSPADTIRRALARAVCPDGVDEEECPVCKGDRALDVLLAVGERDKAEIERLRDWAVCSGCGQDVGESGICTYPGCDDGEMIPASDLPFALRAACDSMLERWKEWQTEAAEYEAERERDRRQIAHALRLLDEVPYEDADAQEAIEAVRAVLAGEEDAPARTTRTLRRGATLASSGWTLIELPASWFGPTGSHCGHRWCLLPVRAAGGGDT